jgi:WD40 repeat protein
MLCLESIYDLQSHPQSDNIILSTSKDGTIRLWDVDQNKCIAIFECDATVTVSWSIYVYV